MEERINVEVRQREKIVDGQSIKLGLGKGALGKAKGALPTPSGQTEASAPL